MGSPSTEIKVIEAKAGLYSRIIFGVFCILTGVGAALWGIWIDHKHTAAGLPEQEAFWTLSHILMIGGMVWAIFGGMLLPSVFDATKPVLTFIFPNGMPIFGGRRQTDPQPTPPSPADEATDGSPR